MTARMAVMVQFVNHKGPRAVALSRFHEAWVAAGDGGKHVVILKFAGDPKYFGDQHAPLYVTGMLCNATGNVIARDTREEAMAVMHDWLAAL